jgi:hypothetical protein
MEVFTPSTGRATGNQAVFQHLFMDISAIKRFFISLVEHFFIEDREFV